MEPKRATEGGQVGVNRAYEGPRGEQTGAKRAPRGYRRGQEDPKWGGGGSQRAQETPKGVPQSELDDSYTVSEGPKGGLKGKNLEKPWFLSISEGKLTTITQFQWL